MTNAHSVRAVVWRSLLAVTSCAVVGAADAYTLWSTRAMAGGAGQLVWLTGRDTVVLGDLTLHNLAFTSNAGFRVPFSNNAGLEPNICADRVKLPTGKLSNGAPLNENVNACSLEIDRRPVLMGIVRRAGSSGEPTAFFDDDGDLVVAAEFTLDFGAGRVFELPLLSTTGTAVVPHPGSRKARDAAAEGKPAYGSEVHGRLGDVDADGWIDGTLVTVGVIPEDAPIAAGEPFVLYRHFQMDVPVAGVRSGDVRNLQRKK